MGRNGLLSPPLYALLIIREIPDPIKKGRDKMNIFTNKDSFYGCLNNILAKDSLLSLFKLAMQIRIKLDRQGYLLDYYLSLFFDGISVNDTSDAALLGNETGGKVQRLLYHIIDGDESEKNHPLYKKIQEVYAQQKHTLMFQERHTKFCLLLFPLADEILNYYTSLYIKEIEDNYFSVDDMVRFRDLYDQISCFVGEPLMEELNKRLQQRFLFAPPVLSFAQGLTYDLLLNLTSRDLETSKQMFQLQLIIMQCPKAGR